MRPVVKRVLIAVAVAAALIVVVLIAGLRQVSWCDDTTDGSGGCYTEWRWGG